MRNCQWLFNFKVLLPVQFAIGNEIRLIRFDCLLNAMFFVVELLCKPVTYVAIPVRWVQKAISEAEDIAKEKNYSSRVFTVFVAKRHDTILKNKKLLRIPKPNFFLPKKDVFRSDTDCCYDAKIWCYRGILQDITSFISIMNP